MKEQRLFQETELPQEINLGSQYTFLVIGTSFGVIVVMKRVMVVG